MQRDLISQLMRADFFFPMKCFHIGNTLSWNKHLMHCCITWIRWYKSNCIFLLQVIYHTCVTMQPKCRKCRIKMCHFACNRHFHIYCNCHSSKSKGKDDSQSTKPACQMQGQPKPNSLWLSDLIVLLSVPSRWHSHCKDAQIHTAGRATEFIILNKCRERASVHNVETNDGIYTFSALILYQAVFLSNYEMHI